MKFTYRSFLLYVAALTAGCSGENSSKFEEKNTAAVEQALTPSLNTWVDACDVTDPAYARLLQAEVFLIPNKPSAITRNLDGTYAINSRAYTTTAGALTLDSSSKFYGQPQALGGRSGFLVSDQHVITAPHTGTFKPSDFVAVFGVASKNVAGTCVQPDFSKVPATNVF